MADRGRTAVYEAEIAAFEGTSYEGLCPFDELVPLARSITVSSWWPHGEVDVVRARSNARSSSANQVGRGTPVIRLAAPQMTPATVVHEFAHVLAGVGEGHGPVFRRAHIDLAGYSFGDEQANWLIDAYQAMGLAPGKRHWPTPTVRFVSDSPVVL